MKKTNSQKFKPSVVEDVIRISYFEACASGLIAYGEKEKPFLEVLSKRLKQSGIYFISPSKRWKITKEALVFMPKDQRSAILRLDWLIKGVSEKEEKRREALEMLFWWAKARTATVPKQVVVGVVVVAIPGITMGKLSRRISLPLLIREDLVRENKIKLNKKITQAVCDFLAKSFQLSEGDVFKSEPEVNEWLFGDKEMCFYLASAAELTRVEKEIEEMEGVSGKVKDEKGIQILALSPAVSFPHLFWQIKEFDFDS